MGQLVACDVRRRRMRSPDAVRLAGLPAGRLGGARERSVHRRRRGRAATLYSSQSTLRLGNVGRSDRTVPGNVVDDAFERTPAKGCSAALTAPTVPAGRLLSALFGHLHATLRAAVNAVPFLARGSIPFVGHEPRVVRGPLRLNEIFGGPVLDG